MKKHPNIEGPIKAFGDMWVVKCRDYVDSTNSQVMDKMISKLISQDKYYILLDFTELNFITSDVPNIMLGHIGAARENGGDILLLSPTQNVMDILELLGISEIFNIAVDMNSAMGYFRHLKNRPPGGS